MLVWSVTYKTNVSNRCRTCSWVFAIHEVRICFCSKPLIRTLHICTCAVGQQRYTEVQTKRFNAHLYSYLQKHVWNAYKNK